MRYILFFSSLLFCISGASQMKTPMQTTKTGTLSKSVLTSLTPTHDPTIATNSSDLTESNPNIIVACLGDSITFGAGITDPGQTYPSQLNGLLGANYVVGNFGRNGATLLNNGDLPYKNLEEYTNAKTFNPNIVVIKLGTNDSKSWNWKGFGSQFVGDYATLIDVFRTLPSSPKIYICLPAKAFSTAFAIDEGVLDSQIRPAIKEIAKVKGVSIIDVFDATKNQAGSFPDGVHPNAAGAGIIATKVYEILSHSLAPITLETDLLVAPLGDAYQWYLNGNLIPASEHGTSRKLKPLQIGNYVVGVKLLATNEDSLISDIFTVGVVPK